MKNYKVIALILIVCYSCILTSCHVHEVQQEDLKKLYGLHVFMTDVTSFDGKRDTDTNEVWIIFESELKCDEYFEIIEKTSSEENWKLLFAREDKRVFGKEMVIYGTTVDLIIVEINYWEYRGDYSLFIQGG